MTYTVIAPRRLSTSNLYGAAIRVCPSRERSEATPTKVEGPSVVKSAAVVFTRLEVPETAR